MIVPRILIRHSRRENSSLLEIGAIFADGNYGMQMVSKNRFLNYERYSMDWLSNFQLDTVYTASVSIKAF